MAQMNEQGRMDIGDKDQQACQLLPSFHDIELGSLLDGVDRVATGIGQANDFGLGALRLK
jgi:hypothetical protein